MYIEMTTFAIPTFLIKLGIAVLGFFALWLVVVVIGVAVYDYSLQRAVRKQMQIDAEIDRLHK